MTDSVVVTAAPSAGGAPGGFEAVASTPSPASLPGAKVGSKKGQSPKALGDLAMSISSKIEELEKSSCRNPAEREASKARKKQLREVLKVMDDKGTSLEDKLSLLSAKFSATVTELLKAEKQCMDAQAQLDLTVKERDKVQAELRKSNVMVDKLQELCRQLQKENKEVLEEAKRVREDDSIARAAMHAKFQAAVQDVTIKMDSQAEERAAQIAENDNLRAKLGEVLQQFETFNQLVTKKDLEVQLANARLEQQAAVSETLTKKNELLEQANNQLSGAHKTIMTELDTLAETRKANVALMHANKDLRQQLDSYGDKFSSFQKTLEKSNKTFDGLKKELEMRSKAQALLQQERDLLKKRCDDTEVIAAKERATSTKQIERLQALVAAVEGVDAEEVKRLRSQKEALESLCRSMRDQLKESTSQRGGGAAECPGASDSEYSAVTATDALPLVRDKAATEAALEAAVSTG